MTLIPPVVEVNDAPQGWLELKVKDSRGVRIGFFQVSAANMDDGLMEALTDWQQRHCHQGGSLSIIRASGEAASF